MGAIARATFAEVEDLVGGDPEWWNGFCGRVSEGGQAAIKEERELRGWSAGALWQWIVRDDGRYREYQGALEAYVQGLALETISIADGADEEAVPKAKLQVETRLRVAGKVDRARWGEKVDHIGVMLDPLSELLREISERKMALLRGDAARVIEASHEIIAEPVGSAESVEDEI